MAAERDVLAELEHEIREALPDARCGPEWRSRHAPECRQEDYEEVLLRVRAVLAVPSPEPLPREALDVERLRAVVADVVWELRHRKPNVSDADIAGVLERAASPEPLPREALDVEDLRAIFRERGWSIFMEAAYDQPLDPFPALAAALSPDRPTPP